VLGAIILNEAARANRRDDGYYEADRPAYGERRGRNPHSCRELAAMCDDGDEGACARFDRQCE
jgi:hypothetical protein